MLLLICSSHYRYLTVVYIEHATSIGFWGLLLLAISLIFDIIDFVHARIYIRHRRHGHFPYFWLKASTTFRVVLMMSTQLGESEWQQIDNG